MTGKEEVVFYKGKMDAGANEGVPRGGGENYDDLFHSASYMLIRVMNPMTPLLKLQGMQFLCKLYLTSMPRR